MFRKLGVFAASLLAVVAFNVQAETVTGGVSNSAKTTVDGYKKLRAVCSVSIGEGRKACFSELNELNAQYRAAKQKLSQKETENAENIHLVSFVD